MKACAWRLLAVILVGALPALAAPSRVRAGRPAKADTSGEVRYLTSTLAYLNRGRHDGVSAGMTLTFTRGGRSIGTCAIDTAGDRWATCVPGALRKGDRFAVARKPDAPPPGPTLQLLSERELAARRDVVATAELALAEFDGDSGGARGQHASVVLGHTTYANLSSAQGAFHVQRVDAAVYDVELYKGLRVSADLSVLNFSSRPETSRSRSAYASTPVLLLRQLEVGFRRPDVPVSGAIGRVWTRWVPGLAVVDGAQAAYRVGDWLETGVYGGLLPTTYNLGLSTSQWGAGAFLMARVMSGQGAKSLLFQTEARVGFSLQDTLGGRFEVGAAAHLYQGREFDGHAQLELAYGGRSQALAGIDAFRLDLGWRPVETLRLFVGARYRGGSPSGAMDLGMTSPAQRAVRADGGATYEATPWLWLAVVSGVASDFAAGLAQGRVGPEVTFPTLLGRGGALMIGYSEEFGWLPGRSAYVQVNVPLFGRARLLSRTSWLQQVGTGLASNDIAESLNVEVAVLRWLWVRASVAGRAQIEQVSGPSRTAGLISVQVGGQY